MNKISETDLYTTYYLNQAGSGYGGIYSGPVYQRGYGIGSFLGGLFRAVIPLLKKGSMIFGKECLKSGLDVINDIENNEEVVDSLKRRGSELYRNVKKRAMDNMTGGRYNTNTINNSRYLSSVSRSGKTKLKNTSSLTKKRNLKQSKRTKTSVKKNNNIKSKKLKFNDIFM